MPELHDQLEELLREHNDLWPHDLAAAILAKGWRPPARVIETADLASECTGTVIRHPAGDVASVDHGPHGEWQGEDTRLHFVGFQHTAGLTLADLIAISDPADTWTVLWSEVEGNA